MTVLLREDFTTLDKNVWGVWSSGGRSPFIRNKRLVVPFDGVMTRNTVGVATRLSFTYGLVTMRLRATPTNFKICPNLWPATGAWTAEVDIAEGPDRLRPTQTLHYGDGVTPMNKGLHLEIHKHYDLPGLGLAEFHDLAVDWQPGSLIFLVEGVERSSIISEHVPDIPMGLHLQVGRPSSYPESGEMVIDWVQVEQ